MQSWWQPHGGTQAETHWLLLLQVLPDGQHSPPQSVAPLGQHLSFNGSCWASLSLRQLGALEGQHCLESWHQRLAMQQALSPPAFWKQVSLDAQHRVSSAQALGMGQQAPSIQAEPSAQQVLLAPQTTVGHSHMLVVVLQFSFAGQLVHF